MNADGYVVKADPTINPTKPEEHWCWEPTDYLYVVQKTDASGKVTGRLVLRSCGDLGADWAIGTVHDLYNDQTHRCYGTWTVVGTKRSHFAGDGEVPNRKLAYYVFK